MTILSVIQQAVSLGKQVVLENLDQDDVRTGDTNPFGDKTLLLDKMAEDVAIDVLRESSFPMQVLTDEQGALDLGITQSILLSSTQSMDLRTWKGKSNYARLVYA